jgi:hypothetical protein
VDFTNIIEPLNTNNIATRELGIVGALKFENCKFENCHFTVTTAAKKNHIRFFFDLLEDKMVHLYHSE